ncbi:MAG: ATP-binding protein [Candidatus Kryptoniota bacterium]
MKREYKSLEDLNYLETLHLVLKSFKNPGFFVYVAEVGFNFMPVKYVSPGFKSITGYNESEFKDLGIYAREIVHPDYSRELMSYYNGLPSKKDTQFIDYKIICKDGTEKWLSERDAVVRDQANKSVITAAVTEITKYQTLIDNLTEKSRELELINKVALFASSSLEIRKIVEIVAAEIRKFIDYDWILIGQFDQNEENITPIFTGKFEDGVFKILDEVCAISIDDDILTTALHNRRTAIQLDTPNSVTNDNHYLSNACVPIIAGIKPIGIIQLKSTKSSAYDEESAKLLERLAGSVALSLERAILFEETRKINQYLIEVNQLKNDFLANTSHELRTPLNSIIGFLTLITEKYYENEEELNQFSRNALESAHHLLRIINDLLDISRIEAGRVQLNMENVYVNDIMKEMKNIFQIQAESKGIKFELNLGTEPIFAYTDAQKLKQVLINIISNAMKFTSRGGISIYLNSLDEKILFTVKDTGIGIPLDKQPGLFQKFYQVDSSTTRKFGGTGLGLVIARSFIEMMGGDIQVESEGIGKGTTVKFTIPKEREAR